MMNFLKFVCTFVYNEYTKINIPTQHSSKSNKGTFCLYICIKGYNFNNFIHVWGFLEWYATMFIT